MEHGSIRPTWLHQRRLNFERWEEFILSICLWLPVKETTDWMLDHTDSELVQRMDLGKSSYIEV